MQSQLLNAGRASRNQLIEALRIVAAFGIVAFHAGVQFREVAYSGLIAFLIISPLVDTLYNWDRVRSVPQLAKRILLPWLFWMIAYGVLNDLRHKHVFPPGSVVADVLYGTSPHLWFMPYIFGVLLLLNSAKRRIPERALFWFSTVMCVSLLSTVSYWRPISLAWSVPFEQWVHAAPAVFYGVVLGIGGRLRKDYAFALPAIGIALWIATSSGLPGISLPYCIGFVSVTCVVLLGSRVPSGSIAIQSVANCMMGVYLSHLVAFLLVQKFLGNRAALVAVATFLFSLVMVWTARRFIPASRLVLG